MEEHSIRQLNLFHVSKAIIYKQATCEPIFPQQSESEISVVLYVQWMVRTSSYSVQYTTTKVKAAAPHTR
jgi:hypothetical protein